LVVHVIIMAVTCSAPHTTHQLATYHHYILLPTCIAPPILNLLATYYTLGITWVPTHTTLNTLIAFLKYYERIVITVLTFRAE